ncbi:MAG: hypothetical protein K8U57_16225 [Planctomycetes bacterium]|nr:hypothetical protein [Planctomycetota bacterium]
MTLSVRFLMIALALAVLAGCGDSTPTPVPTDPDSVKKLEELQKQGGKGEKR